MIHPGDMAGKGPLGLKGAKPRRDRDHMARVADNRFTSPFQGDTVNRRDGASHLPAAPNRNGSYEDHVMAERQLPSPGVLRQLLHYEPETGNLFWKERGPEWFVSDSALRMWNTRYAEKQAGTKDPRGYIGVRLGGGRIWAHRIAWAISHLYWPTMQIDHIDGDRSNNSLVNLRECSNAENSRNSKLFSNSSSGICGVTWDKRHRKWKAHAKVDGISYSLGSFDRKDHAAKARLHFENMSGAFTKMHGVRQ